ncbi:MAG: hypothetical protein QHH74_16145 [Spirochaetota bacterium]|nr:hypothetical protein [Spirochaetota bacterium]
MFLVGLHTKLDLTLSEKYFNFLTSLGHTKIVNTSDDFYKAVDELILLNAYDVKRKNSSIFELNYEDNLKKQLKVLLDCD